MKRWQEMAMSRGADKTFLAMMAERMDSKFEFSQKNGITEKMISKLEMLC